jgi:transketolase
VPEFERDADIKIIAVTSPELFEELRAADPNKADAILSNEERATLLAFHNGWKGFLYPFLLSGDYDRRSFGIDRFLRSGRPDELYAAAGFDVAGIRDKIASRLKT